MNMKIKLLVGVCTIAFLSGCAAITTPVDEDYQLGDTMDSVLTLQAKYCAETNPTKRAIYLQAAKSIMSFYPERGACTDLAELVGGQAAVELIAQDELEVSEAVKEQEKYKEYLDSQQDNKGVINDY